MFLYFKTADGCYQIQPVSPNWIPVPIITVPLRFVILRDWVDDSQPTFEEKQSVRRYKLEKEELLQDGITKVFSYIEVIE